MTEQASAELVSHQAQCGSYEYTKRKRKQRGSEFHDIYYRCLKCGHEIKAVEPTSEESQVPA